jgi:hypothetical protein
MKALIAKLPLFVRKFIVDFAETGLVAVLGLSLAGDAAAMLHTALLALGVAALAAARRELPDFLAFLKDAFSVAEA